MNTTFVLLKITTDGDVPDIADKAAGRIYTASGVRDCVVITPMLKLPEPDLRQAFPRGESLGYHSEEQIRQIQVDAYAEGRRDAEEGVVSAFEAMTDALEKKYRAGRVQIGLPAFRSEP